MALTRDVRLRHVVGLMYEAKQQCRVSGNMLDSLQEYSQRTATKTSIDPVEIYLAARPVIHAGHLRRVRSAHLENHVERV